MTHGSLLTRKLAVARRLARGASRVHRDAAVRVACRVSSRFPVYWYRGTPNLGDQLSPVVLDWVTGGKSTWVSGGYRGKILGVGSILRVLEEGDTVWGAGSIEDRPIQPPPHVRFLAVRGPLTRSLVRSDVPEVYGDPVLLLPRFHRPPVVKTHEIGIVPHYVDRGEIEAVDPAFRLIDVRQPWRNVVAQIRSCEFIISSSLHGLIVAESYGITASWIRITDRVAGGDFKFNDYYLSTGRDATQATPWRAGVNEAIKQAAPPATFDPEQLLSAARKLASGI